MNRVCTATRGKVLQIEAWQGRWRKMCYPEARVQIRICVTYDVQCGELLSIHVSYSPSLYSLPLRSDIDLKSRTMKEILFWYRTMSAVFTGGAGMRSALWIPKCRGIINPWSHLIPEKWLSFPLWLQAVFCMRNWYLRKSCKMQIIESY